MSTRPSRAAFSNFIIIFAFAAVVFALPQSAADAKRDAWQRPGEVMNALDVKPGSHVADIGCGEGYFVMHLARRVGAEGVVFGVDVDDDALGKLRRSAEDAKLSNVRIVHGRSDDPRLPAAELDAVLLVNAYHEMRQHDAMLRAILAALKPHGRLAIIDAPGKGDLSREEHQSKHTIAESLVREDAQRNGFRFLSKENGFEPNRENGGRGSWFFLIFEKPGE